MTEDRLDQIAVVLHLLTLSAFFAAGYGMGTHVYAWTVIGVSVVAGTWALTRIIDRHWPEVTE